MAIRPNTLGGAKLPSQSRAAHSQEAVEVLIVGGYPPPTGGVTIHIERFHQFCQKERFPIRIITQFNSAPHKDVLRLKGGAVIQLFHLIYLILRFKGKIIHIHAARFNKLLYGGLPMIWAASSKVKILTYHTDAGASAPKGALKQWALKRILSRFEYLICVNENQKEYFANNLGITKNKLLVIPSFIPLQNIPGNVSGEIRDFVHAARKRVDYLVISTGYLTEIYGYDMIIDAVKDSPGKTIGIIFVFYTSTDKTYQKILSRKMKSFPNIWSFQDLSSDDFFYLIQHSDVFIRANREDTYGMVVGDAITLGTPAIASNVCKRHEGAILFESGNIGDLREKIITTLEDLSEVKKRQPAFSEQNFATNVLDLYKRILSEKL